VFRNGTEPELIASLRNEGSGPHPRQRRSHPHCAIFTRDNAWIYAADMGSDEVLAFPFDADAGRVGDKIRAYRAAPGSGPRHVLLRHAMTIFDIDTRGELRASDQVTVRRRFSSHPSARADAQLGAYHAGALSASGLVKSTQSMTLPIQHTRSGSPREACDRGVQLTSHQGQVIRQPPA
jgi:hypothetical protein